MRSVKGKAHSTFTGEDLETAPVLILSCFFTVAVSLIEKCENQLSQKWLCLALFGVSDLDPPGARECSQGNARRRRCTPSLELLEG